MGASLVKACRGTPVSNTPCEHLWWNRCFGALQRLCWAAFQCPPFGFSGLTIQHSFYYNAFLLHPVYHVNSECPLQIYKKQLEYKRGAVCDLLCLKLFLSLLSFLITFIYRAHVCMYTHTCAHTQWGPMYTRVELKEQLNSSHFSPPALWILGLELRCW